MTRRKRYGFDDSNLGREVNYWVKGECSVLAKGGGGGKIAD